MAGFSFMFQVTKDHHHCFICATVGFSIVSQTPLKTHLLPVGIVKSEENSECESHAVFWILNRRSVRQIEERNFRTADAFCLKMLLPLALVGCLKINWFLVVMPWLCHNLLSLILSWKLLWWSPNCPILPVHLKEKGRLPSHLIIFQAIKKAGTLLSRFLVLCSPACQRWALLQELNRGVVWDLPPAAFLPEGRNRQC